jgi:hypothetical protein
VQGLKDTVVGVSVVSGQMGGADGRGWWRLVGCADVEKELVGGAANKVGSLICSQVRALDCGGLFLSWGRMGVILAKRAWTLLAAICLTSWRFWQVVELQDPRA